MFIGLMKRIFLTLLVLACLAIPAQAQNTHIPQIEDGIYNLLYVRQQMQAVDNDMILYFGWMPEEKKEMKKTARKCIQEIDRLKRSLMSKEIPAELTDVKNEMENLLKKQEGLYQGVESKTDKQIRSFYADFQKALDAHTKHVDQKLDQYLITRRPPDDFSVLQEELKLFTDQKDQALFKEAENLLQNEKFKKGYDILLALKDKYKNTPIEASILLKMSDCILNFDTDLPKDVAVDENGLKMLNQILDKKAYSPILYDVFYRWRTKEQEFNHGMSNYSEIPNLEYNDKRMEIVKVIQQYLTTHPDDNWARVQIIALLTLDNIVRGEAFGNSNLRYSALLYMNLDKKNDNTEVKEAKANKR